MKIQDIAAAVVAVWALSAVTVLFGSAHITSFTDVLALAIFGVWPPLVIWFRLNDPGETMSATVRRIREESHTSR
jgi:cytosine/uracil/thiamine/allantoin permease